MRGKFPDRLDAGRQLAERLQRFAGRPDVLVLGLARGGVPVASEVARVLNLPLDVFVVRKLATPGEPDHAIGALTTGGVRVLDAAAIDALRVADETVERLISEEHVALERREDAYRNLRPTPDVHGRTVLLVDDRLVVGAGIFPAVAALLEQGPAAIVVAAPVATSDALEAMRRRADDVICVATPTTLNDLGAWYGDRSPTTDAEVRELLDAAAFRRGDNGRLAGAAPVRPALAAPPG